MQAGLDEGLRGDGLTSDKHAELNRLRRENRVLREEREILSQAPQPITVYRIELTPHSTNRARERCTRQLF